MKFIIWRKARRKFRGKHGETFMLFNFPVFPYKSKKVVIYYSRFIKQNPKSYQQLIDKTLLQARVWRGAKNANPMDLVERFQKNILKIIWSQKIRVNTVEKGPSKVLHFDYFHNVGPSESPSEVKRCSMLKCEASGASGHAGGNEEQQAAELAIVAAQQQPFHHEVKIRF